MARMILINAGVREVRIALLNDDVATDIIIEPNRRWSLVGNIYLGRVDRVAPAINAAFVDLGFDKSGFLGANQAHVHQHLGEQTDEVVNITEQVHEGETILVQVINDPVASKGPKLTRDLSFPGRCIVHKPFQKGVTLSRRIESHEERRRLEHLVAGALARNNLHGAIVRTAGGSASQGDIEGETAYFALQWADIMDRHVQSDAPLLLHRDLDPVSKALRDFLSEDIDQVLIDTSEGLETASDYCSTFVPAMIDRLALHQGHPALYEAFGLEEIIEGALEPRVELVSGGSIYIEATEALTAIDVNTGRFIDASSMGDAATKINLEAAVEIARQLRLRSIGGLIVIDFVHMIRAEDAAQVMVRLKEELQRDRTPTRIGEISEFGLVEMTRKRVRKPLVEFFSEVCDPCDGSGRRWGAAAVASEILRRAEVEGSMEPSQSVAIIAAPDVVNELQIADGADINVLGRRLGKAIDVSVNHSFAREQYEIVMV